jgi:hypothetical protein
MLSFPRFSQPGGGLVVAAREIALGTLDLDHSRAGIGELLGASGGRDCLLHRDDKQAFERPRWRKIGQAHLP